MSHGPLTLDGSSQVVAFLVGKRLIAFGDAFPVDGTSGYLPGCQFFDKTNGRWYINEGSVTSCDFNRVSTGGLDLSTLTATAAEINRATDVSTRLVTVAASSLTLAEATHEGKTVVLSLATGIAVALPAATGSGARYRFVIGVTITTTSVTTFTRAGSDVIYGQVYQLADGGSTLAAFELPGSTVITLGTSANTTGGTLGDSLEFEDIAAGKWWCVAHTTAAGTEATPVT